jgi:hypothetical protein
MQAFCGAFPVLPGKTEATKEFAKTVIGPRYKEFDAALKRRRTTKEAWFLQKTPQGDMMMVYFEAADVEKTFQDFARSTEPFDRWFKDQVKALTGVDLNQPEGSAPEQILAYGY